MEIPSTSSFIPKAEQSTIVDGFPVDAMIRRLSHENSDDCETLAQTYNYLTISQLSAMISRLNIKNTSHMTLVSKIKAIITAGRKQGYNRFKIADDSPLSITSHYQAESHQMNIFCPVMKLEDAEDPLFQFPKSFKKWKRTELNKGNP